MARPINKWQVYELAKAMITWDCKTAEEYEAKIKALCKELGI